MDDRQIESQIMKELREALVLKRANEELLEYFASSLMWLIRYSEKYNMPLPEKEKIIIAISRVIEIAERIPPSSEQPNRNTSRRNTTKFLVVFH